jgi:hypothetical protein
LNFPFYINFYSVFVFRKDGFVGAFTLGGELRGCYGVLPYQEFHEANLEQLVQRNRGKEEINGTSEQLMVNVPDKRIIIFKCSSVSRRCSMDLGLKNKTLRRPPPGQL